MNIVNILGIGGGGGKSGLYRNLGQCIHVEAGRAVADASNIILNIFFYIASLLLQQKFVFRQAGDACTRPASANPSIF